MAYKTVLDKKTGELTKVLEGEESAEDISGELTIPTKDLTAEEATSLIGSLTGLATAALEKILRNPSKNAPQVVAAAKLIYERKLGAVPDTVIQNNMNFVVKWQD